MKYLINFKLKHLIDILFINIYLWISFRSDSLFIPGSEYHWSYFVGVVQGVQNGGWLLWDTPSQYGFLNVLLASLIPSSSPWQSFYIFQGTLLFLIATSSYFLICRNLSDNLFPRFFIFLVLFMGIFFADPAYIGPYPYPSSSVVRFFFVYILIFTVFIIPKFSLKQAFLLSIITTLGILWSAESFIYSISIYSFVFFALIAQMYKTKIWNNKLIYFYIVIPVTILALVLLAIYSFYLFHISQLPDLKGFFEYAFGYAGGFGYVPFSFTGPGNILFIIFVCLSFFFIASLLNTKTFVSSPFAAMLGGLWAISSYYIGRPVPQNITALLPIILIILLLAYRAITLIKSHHKLNVNDLFFKMIAIPIFFVALLPIFDQKWLDVMLRTKSFSEDIALNLPKADKELLFLMSKIDTGKIDSIIYYGDNGAPPRFEGHLKIFNNKNWLPIPLQLLEAPIEHQRSTEYLRRYIKRNKYNNVVIISPSDPNLQTRLSIFIYDLNKFYNVDNTISNLKYKIFILKRNY